jgi:hypothetical protein
MAKRFLFAWGLGLVLLYLVVGWFCARALRAAHADTDRRQRAFVETTSFGDEAKPIDPATLAGAEVKVGVFVDHVGDLDVASTTFSTDFEVWFRWRDDGLHPGETFQVMNGNVTSRTKTESSDEGGEHYERWRVHAKAQGAIDAVRYPFGDVALSIQIEDGRDGVNRIRYVADAPSSGVSFEALPQELHKPRTLATVKYVAYLSTLGHATKEVRSRFVFVMVGTPQSSTTYLKSFQALFAAVAVALLAFFIKPIHVDPRFGLGVGAIFAATANNISVAAAVPPVHEFTLTAMVNAIGLGTIFLSMVESAISLYLLDSRGLVKLYKVLDAISFTIFVVAYVTLNIVLLVTAAQL